MIKMKIGKKLLLTYFLLLITVLTVTGVTFRVLIQRYLISEARTALRTEAQAIADTLEKVPIFDGKIRPNLLAKREMKVHGQFIESKVIILNNNKKVIYNNLEGNDKRVLQDLVDNNRLKVRGYVSERVPIISKDGEVKGHVFLFTRIDDLNKIGKVMNRTQFMSLIIGGAAAVILGMIFQSGLTRPIQKLKRYMTDFSFKSSQQELKIKTGDEIEELAERFLSMVEKLRVYDTQQKRFLQNASHELKTPLMSIQGYAEAIKDGIVEEKEIHESLDVIIDESRRLKKIVDEMIYIIKLDNVEETFCFESANIKEIIDQSVKSVKALIDAKGIKLIAEGDCSCEGCFDKEKLARAVINILSNGIRYSEKEITINWKTHDNHIKILIIDDGKGFQNGEEDKIFERFYKGENGGTGIGLAIAKAVISAHNGQIKAYNAVPRGAVFEIILPRMQK
ncbi:MAG: HAMP domain-containing sensor histidine kinase [Clostridiaceae bacterium]|jgi:signal transduction histidine kinase|nr:HAMP domain-containing sensor histidine kinase [Clostridiaceae bacterium]